MNYIFQIFVLFFLLITTANAKVKVVTTLSDYAVITQQIGGEFVQVQSIVAPAEDPHHVRPKPSFALALSQADMFVTTGLDLELWVPSLVNRAGNHRIRSGQVGYVSAAAGIPLLEKPQNLSHSEGGLHLYGNPHIMTSPLNILYVARNIATGLVKVDPSHRSFYEQQLNSLTKQLYIDLFGKTLVELLDGPSLFSVAENGVLYSLLEKRELMGKLGGWFKRVSSFRGKNLVSYHKNWDYLCKILNLKSIETIEVKPGVPPTPAHVMSVIQMMKKYGVQTILGASYFSVAKMKMVANKVGANLIVLTMGSKRSDNSAMDKFNRWAAQFK